jgi:ABC-2 type transport system ATP-binding protein
MNSVPIAELGGVTKRFGSIVALENLSLSVWPGELLAILGPNGAGKSTAISLWLGLERPAAGRASLFDCRNRSTGYSSCRPHFIWINLS